MCVVLVTATIRRAIVMDSRQRTNYYKELVKGCALDKQCLLLIEQNTITKRVGD